MRKAALRGISILLILCIGMGCLAGCYGKFELTRKLYQWNGQVGDKWVNTIVMWVLMIVPAYEAVGFVDVFILNVIEFWTGENPLAMESGEKEVQVVEMDGRTYEITATANRFDIVQKDGDEAGRTVSLIYEAETGAWYTESEADGRHKIAEVDGEHPDVLTLIQPDGEIARVHVKNVL